jgi:hypothetical protein
VDECESLVTGAASLLSTLSITGATALSSTLDVDGAADIAGTLTLSGNSQSLVHSGSGGLAVYSTSRATAYCI